MTLTQLKKDAKAGKLFAKMVLRNGDTDIPTKLQGKRQIVDANSVGITFLNNEGKKSELRIPCASLVEYTKETLTIYEPGLRELTADEQAMFDKWEKVRDKKQEELDLLTDGSSSYWKHKFFFKDAGYEYLLGFDTIRGLKYDFNTKMVRDNKIKGDICMRYEFC